MYVCLDHSHSGSGWLCHFTSFSAFLGDAFLIALGCSHIPARLHCHPLSQSRLRKNASNLADLQQVLANQWQLTVYSNFGYGSIPIDTFLVGWTSIYQLFWGSLGTRVLTHPQISVRYVHQMPCIFHVGGPIDAATLSPGLSHILWRFTWCVGGLFVLVEQGILSSPIDISTINIHKP